MFREDDRRAAAVRDALCRRVEAEPAARRALPRRPRLHRGRRRASRDPDRRARHELRAPATPSICRGSSRRCCRAGAGRGSCRPTRPSAARSASTNVAASRYATLGRRKWRSMWKPDIRDAHADGRSDARRARARRRRRAAQVERDDRRRARLPLSSARRWSRRSRARGRSTTSSPIIRRLAGRAAAAYLARRRHRDAGPHRLRPAASRCCGSGARRPTCRGSTRRSRRYGAPFRVLDMPDEEPRAVYGYDLILLRPDMHVAWRGNAPPEDAARLAAMVTGH